jgi:hypothetical protein
MDRIQISKPKALKAVLALAAIMSISSMTVRTNAETLPANDTDRATASVKYGRFTFGNQWIEVAGDSTSGRWGGLRITDVATRRSVQLPVAFSLTLKDGSVLNSTNMPLTESFAIRDLSANATASRESDRLPGKEICAKFGDGNTPVQVEWCGILRDGSNYFRQQIAIESHGKPAAITKVQLLQFHLGGGRVTGTVNGSPITDGTMFFAFENPLSVSEMTNGEATAFLTRELPLRPGQSVTYSAVVGVAPPGQLRRAFLRYIERERAHPYRTFLQYNTWYDLGYTNRYDEAGAVNRIDAFGTELVKKRGVKISSFVFDDGWDNPNSLWDFDSGFPDGFHRASQAAAQFGSHIGVWFSPWGGYDEQKKERVAFGRSHGYEIVNGGFALSAPKYYALFEKTCLNMVRNYGANEFKFDGTGNANRVFPGSEFDSDFDALLHLIHRLRRAEPNIFINATTGTYPSPFWLFDTDAIWRGGDDHSFAGVGSSRQRWITYRDSQVYKNIVQRGPLFPLNSLMLHGMIFARLADGLNSDPNGDFRDEVESFFGSGTQVQEMYITPSLLSQRDWDILAKGANWSRKNAETLKDTHWIGGDPGKLKVYGWASWSPVKAIVVLRNPSDKPQTFALDIQTVLQLPSDATRAYLARDSWNEGSSTVRLAAGHIVTIQLKPWEVRTFDAKPMVKPH